MSKKKKSKRRKPAKEKPLLSHSSILILSGFLIGMFARKAVRPDFENYAYIAGIIGLIAFYGLDHVARRRHESEKDLACERAALQLENRIDRHVPQNSSEENESDVPMPAGSQSELLTAFGSERIPSQ